MASVSDIAWLAGIIDGEGCFAVKSPHVRKDGHRRGYQLWLVLCNTSYPMMERAERILASLGVKHQPMRRVWKGKKATRWQFWLHVARKQELLRVTEILLPHLTAKRVEGEIVVWFLRRACRVKAYKATTHEEKVIASMAEIKRCGGEAPAELHELLREVIPSQVLSGGRTASDWEREGRETTSVRPNDNPTHERPAAQVS